MFETLIKLSKYDKQINDAGWLPAVILKVELIKDSTFINVFFIFPSAGNVTCNWYRNTADSKWSPSPDYRDNLAYRTENGI